VTGVSHAPGQTDEALFLFSHNSLGINGMGFYGPDIPPVTQRTLKAITVIEAITH